MNTLEVNYKHKINNWKDFKNVAKKQFLNYETLEGRNWKEYDFCIDCSEDQMLFKDMLQIRCIEELTEAYTAFEENDYEHFKEEITDSINFFVSAMVMCGYLDKLPEPYLRDVSNSKQLFKTINKSYLNTLFFEIVEKIGYLCNLLKNRPWAQSNYLVSIIDYEERINALWSEFWANIHILGISKEEMFEMFERKYEVNKWRIKTGY